MAFGSFLFLNPRLVRRWPNRPDDVCYLAYKDEPEVLCSELPANRWTFLGTWALTPERHFQEWIGFVAFGALILTFVGPRLNVAPTGRGGASTGETPATKDQQLLRRPRRWMQISTLAFYPYVAWTKLNWSNSNYPMRWLLFVGMPVGTLWILSALHSLILPFASVPIRRRHYLLQMWLSFLPSLWPVFQSLFSSILLWILKHEGKGGWDTLYNVMYISHVIYLCLVPAFYIIVGEMTTFPRPKNDSKYSIRYILSAQKESILWQLVGNALACLYYVGIMTPLSIYAGLNVNEMLRPNRTQKMLRWFMHGCILRGILCILEILACVLKKRREGKHREA